MFMKKCAVAVTLALTLTVFACLVPFSWWTARAAAAPKASAVNESADFRGKVLLLRSIFGLESVVLEQVKVRQLGDHSFLVGKVVEAGSGKDLRMGKTVWQNVDQISQIIECESVDEARKTLKALPGEGIGSYSVPVSGTAPAVPAIPPEPLPQEKRKK
jgi:hypothetical protein